nr:immunoglobulin light chain junction region [Macaca mulatta]MOV99103.1 immunoglobulin light chain junction region [Macaca mulatta]MOV99895.1 immunoglobulin light chain junction region [Macaca mulatta]
DYFCGSFRSGGTYIF